MNRKFDIEMFSNIINVFTVTFDKKKFVYTKQVLISLKKRKKTKRKVTLKCWTIASRYPVCCP